MAVLITGAAGFIGSSIAHKLMDRGEEVVGVDNLNDYYDPALKEARLARLQKRDGFRFHKLNIADKDGMFEAFMKDTSVTKIIHLAAQAGVRYSLINPFAYIETNLMGQGVMLELARHMPNIENMVYASSSSVYGSNKKIPFSVDDRVDNPISLYAATKKADELMGHTYSHLYDIPLTGMRFFTVYGPWGRPDMALYIFTNKIFKGEPIDVFNNGDMRRDFTYIDDIVAGTIAALDNPPKRQGDIAPHTVYNIGNNNVEQLMDLIGILEKTIGIEAEKNYLPMQPGDVQETYADIDKTTADLGYKPTTTIAEGIPKFVEWYREYHKV